jgi:hypothetical protein
MFFEKLKDLITLFETWLLEPEDYVQLEQWIDSADKLADSYDFTDVEQSYIDKIIEMYEEQYKKLIEKKQQDKDIPAKKYLDELLSRNQTEQRTAAWYAEMTNIISASEIGNLFASPYQRGKMVMSKVLPYKPRNQPLAVLSSTMSAFDWGIRFEPVVKLIYEYKYGVELKELGRMYHPNDGRCTASPDGLVYSCPKNERTGRLVEIKCPVTREIDGSIPKDYYAQIQLQLQVTGLKKCDYIEAVFSSKYNNICFKEGPGLYNGYIGLIRYADFTNNNEFYYVYSPVNIDSSWTPDIKENEEIVEIVPWYLLNWGEQIVTRNDEWWQNLQPIIHNFWEDVEKAKRGEFIIPESTRIHKKLKEDKCLIQFNKLDENGNEIIQ